MGIQLAIRVAPLRLRHLFRRVAFDGFGTGFLLGPVNQRGPVSVWVGKTLVNAEGVQAVNYKYVPPGGATWQPQWIWVSGAQK